MRYKFGILAFAVASFFGSQSAFADQLITNGGFETGDFTGFTVSGPITTSSNPSLFYGVDTLDAYPGAGTYGAYLSTLPGQLPLVLSEMLTVAPSHNYTLSFDLANLGGALPSFPNSFVIALNGTTLFTETNVGASPYSVFTYNFTTAAAAPASEVFTISSTNTASYFSLDNVSVSTTITPEPATLLLIVPAFGLLALRRRKAA